MLLKEFLIYDKQEESKDVTITPEPLEITLELLIPRVVIDKSESYVYVYLDPRKPGKYSYEGLDCSFLFEPFYVGKGYDNRCFGGIKSAYKNKDKVYNLKHRIIRKIKEVTSKDPIIIKYRQNLSDKESLELEIKLISIIGRKDIGKGFLTNLTDGGEGIRGKIYTEDELKRKSELVKGEKHPNFGKHRIEETKQKIREKRKFQIITDETRRKLSIVGKGKKHSEEWGKKISESNKGSKNYNYGKSLSIETKRKISEASKGKKHSLETKRKISEAKRNKHYKHTDETRKKISENRRGKTVGIKNPFYGKHHSEESIKKMVESKKDKLLGIKV